LRSTGPSSSSSCLRSSLDKVGETVFFLKSIDRHNSIVHGIIDKIVFFYLSENQLTGSIPSSMASLTNLLYLYLSDNQLTGSIPSSMGLLTKLETLYLYDNQLSGIIPSSMGLLTKLSTLLLSNNQLKGTMPTSLCSSGLIALIFLQ
jgi:Leucine-rich repeat (LRR) protein